MTLIAGSYYYNVFVMLLTAQQNATFNIVIQQLQEKSFVNIILNKRCWLTISNIWTHQICNVVPASVGPWSRLIVRLKWRRNEEEVQSCLLGEISFNTDVGIVVGEQEVWGFSFKNSDVLFLDSWSATVLDVPGIWQAEILILKWAEKNQRQRRRCITIINFPLKIL